MPDSIFLLNPAGQLQELTEAPYLTEAKLQELLAAHPDLLAGKQLDEESPRRWLFIDREMGVPDRADAGSRWSLDHLFIDQDGIPTLVEVKRATDTRIRREVVGQVLDYAANAAAYWTVEGIIASFEKACADRGEESDTVLNKFLGADAGAGEEVQSARFWESVNTNLRAGKIRMLIVADYIPSELQRIIEFLNEQMSPADILGVAIKQFRSGETRTLVPRVVGLTSVGASKKVRRSGGATTRPRWTLQEFYSELDKTSIPAGQVARRIVAYFESRGFVMVGGKGKTPSIIPEIHDPLTVYPFAMASRNWLEMYFQYYVTKPPFDQLVKRQELMDRLNTIPGVELPADKIDKRPSFSLDLLAPEESMRTFLATFDWFLKEIQSVTN
ncbi:PDDEXK family nuclease [Neolewinella antarctica]|uniref:DUF91 domain-containing protein n=1 Tax=Neolewinella antarctica TaxID=442734 RepID=A0ABX0XCT3_9BACT|nr:hypothetical protein [Neolewinella antarctica]NJC27022.1 hypothetical protein [Neolewinella antarctica]